MFWRSRPTWDWGLGWDWDWILVQCPSIVEVKDTIAEDWIPVGFVEIKVFELETEVMVEDRIVGTITLGLKFDSCWVLVGNARNK